MIVCKDLLNRAGGIYVKKVTLTQDWENGSFSIRTD